MLAYLGMYVNSAIYGVLPIIVYCGISVFSAKFICQKLKIDERDALILVFAFSMVGAATGIFVGASKNSIVSVAVPAFLTLVSGLAAYQFAKKSEVDEKWREILPLSIGFLFFSAIGTASFSASTRAASEQADRRYEEWRLMYEKVQLPINVERLRRDLGLPKPAEK